MVQDPQIIDHKFRQAKLSYYHNDGEIVPNKQHYWRVSLFFYKKPSISEEYFARHWHHVHGDLVTASKAYLENNLLRYNQFRQDSEAKKLADSMEYGPLLDFDAVTEFWVKDLQQFKQCMKSDEFTVYTKDVNNFIDVEKGVKIMVGYDNLVYGEAVPGYGNDGVVRADIEAWHRDNPDVSYAEVQMPDSE